MSDEKEIYQQFSVRVQKLRKEMNLTQRDVARMLGMLPMTYGRYENAKHKVTLGILHRMAEVLNVSEEYLVTGNASSKKDGYTKIGIDTLSASDMHLITMYRGLDERGRTIINNILEHEYRKVRQKKNSDDGNELEMYTTSISEEKTHDDASNQ